jgi:tRNA (guanine26-N2/guanine27-N2)-dimethyltransferase
MREWVKQKAPIKDGAIRKGTAGWNIMRLDEQPKKEPIGDAPKGEEEANEAAKHSNIVFDETLGKETNTRRLVRYQVNPRENWGPMNRANGHG